MVLNLVARNSDVTFTGNTQGANGDNTDERNSIYFHGNDNKLNVDVAAGKNLNMFDPMKAFNSNKLTIDKNNGSGT